MSTRHQQRGKGRNMHRPFEEQLLRPSLDAVPTGTLRTAQTCYCCAQRMPAGTQAVFSKRRSGWRHKGCSVPLPGRC
jgi:hypothetical protein